MRPSAMSNEWSGLAVVSLNGWNRLNIAARTVPGDYAPGMFTKVNTFV